jgi:hypothetical protein
VLSWQLNPWNAMSRQVLRDMDIVGGETFGIDFKDRVGEEVALIDSSEERLQDVDSRWCPVVFFLVCRAHSIATVVQRLDQLTCKIVCTVRPLPNRRNKIRQHVCMVKHVIISGDQQSVRLPLKS